jgi:hypothetical protein
VNGVINGFSPGEQGPLYPIKFFGIMVLVLSLSGLSTKAGLFFGEDDDRVSPPLRNEKAGKARTPRRSRDDLGLSGQG